MTSPSITYETLFKAVNTVREMLEDRGTPATLIAEWTRDKIVEALQVDKVIGKGEWCGIRVRYDTYVGFYLKKFQIRIPRAMCAHTDAPRVIMVLVDKPTNHNIQSIASVQAQEGCVQSHVETFWLKELQFNISRHVLVPRHERVPDNDVDAVLSKFNLNSRSQLPLIRPTDPMARYLGLAPNDIVRVLRHSPASGRHETFRICL
jgi:DNA-directed RNA polymerase subunit H (RpoH/RPB5)